MRQLTGGLVCERVGAWCSVVGPCLLVFPQLPRCGLQSIFNTPIAPKPLPIIFILNIRYHSGPSFFFHLRVFLCAWVVLLGVCQVFLSK